MQRLFIGIAISDEIANSLLPLQTDVKGAKYSPRENFHITLRFVGNLNEAMTEQLATLLQEIRHASFDLSLAGVGFFGEDKPNSMHAKIAPAQELLTLAKECEAVCRNLGLAPETREFRPHVTLAYLTKDADLPNLLEWQARNNHYKSGKLNVDSFSLYSSRLGNGPSQYEIQTQITLLPPQ